MTTVYRIIASIASIALIALVAPAPIRAATVWLPLRGNYRVGKYFPAWVSSARSDSIEVRGDGLLPVRVRRSGESLVPLLVLENPTGELTVSGERVTVDLHPLADDERLVGTIGAVREISKELFRSDVKIIRVVLDPAAVFAGPAVAWETLDAVVCDAGSLSAVRDESIGVLLGRGVRFAVPAMRGNAPSDRFIWYRSGDGWMLRHDPIGPPAAVAPGGYAPVEGWTPGWSGAVRARVVIAAMFSALAVLGVSVIASRRWMSGTLLVVSLGSVFVIALWSNHQPTLRQVAGGVFMPASTAQYDDWTYYTPTGAAADVRTPWIEGDLRPIVTSYEQCEATGLLLECSDDDRPKLRISARLERGMKLATLQRLVYREGRAFDERDETGSPMRALVRACYTQPWIRAAGQGSAREGRFPDVIMRAIASSEQRPDTSSDTILLPTTRSLSW